MKLTVSVADYKVTKHLSARPRISQSRATVTAKLDTIQDIKNLVDFVQAIYNGNPIELCSDSGSSFDVGPGFCRVELVIPYRYKTDTLDTGETFENALQCYGCIDVSNWIPESFSKYYPVRTAIIKKRLNDLLNTSLNYSSKSFVLTFWEGHLYSFATGVAPVEYGDKQSRPDSYALFGLPTNFSSEDLIEFSQHETTRWNVRTNVLIGPEQRIVIGKNYFRYNANEMTNGEFSLLINSEHMSGCMRYGPSINKNTVFDRGLYSLIMDDPSVVNSFASNYMDWPALGSREMKFNSTLGATGLVVNQPKWNLRDFFVKLKFDGDELPQLRDALKQDNLYLKAFVGIDFAAHLAVPKQKLTLQVFADGLLGVLTKSAAKQETEIKVFKTRVFNNIKSYLLSIAYSVVVETDFTVPEGCSLDTFSLSGILTASRRNGYQYENFSPEKYLKTCSVEFTDACEKSLKTSVESFLQDFEMRSVTVSPQGNPSIITTYCYEKHVPVYCENGGAEYSWLYKLDTSNYCANQNYGLVRSMYSGMDLDLQSISAAYLMSSIRRTEDPYNGRRFYEVEAKRQFLEKQHQFYQSNCIPNSAIEAEFTEYIRRCSDIYLGGHYIKYQEFFTLSDESMGILSGGYKCSDFQTLFDWWESVSPLLLAQVTFSNTHMTPSKLVFVNYLFRSTDFIINKLKTNIDRLS